jgi:phospholipase D1/2
MTLKEHVREEVMSVPKPGSAERAKPQRPRSAGEKRAGRPKTLPTLLVVALWLGGLFALWWLARTQGQTPGSLLQAVLEALREHPLAPFFLFGLYLIRPLFLLPVTLLTLTSGLMFGAFWGFWYAAAASLASATVAYSVGRFFTRDLTGRIGQGVSTQLQRFPFETILLCRFLLLPGDLVNYLAGFLRVHLGAFWAATLVGGSPGLLVGVLAGASLEGLPGEVRLNAWYLVASGVLLGLSLGVSRWLRRRNPFRSPQPSNSTRRR